MATDWAGVNLTLTGNVYPETAEILATRAEVELLQARARQLECLRQMVAAGPAGMTDYREWRDYVCSRPGRSILKWQLYSDRTAANRTNQAESYR